MFMKAFLIMPYAYLPLRFFNCFLLFTQKVLAYLHREMEKLLAGMVSVENLLKITAANKFTMLAVKKGPPKDPQDMGLFIFSFFEIFNFKNKITAEVRNLMQVISCKKDFSLFLISI